MPRTKVLTFFCHPFPPPLVPFFSCGANCLGLSLWSVFLSDSNFFCCLPRSSFLHLICWANDPWQARGEKGSLLYPELHDSAECGKKTRASQLGIFSPPSPPLLSVMGSYLLLPPRVAQSGGGGRKREKESRYIYQRQGGLLSSSELGQILLLEMEKKGWGGKGEMAPPIKKLSKSQRSTRWRIAFFLKKVRRSQAIFPLLAFQLFKYFSPPIPPLFPSCCRIRAICLSSLFLWRGHFSPSTGKRRRKTKRGSWEEKRFGEDGRFLGGPSFCDPPSIGTPRASTSTGRGVPVKQEVDSQTTTKTFPPLFFGKTPTPSEEKKLFFFLEIPRPPDFLGQPSDSVVVPMCTPFCGPDTSGAMLDRSGRCAERKINGSTTPSRESGRSPPPPPSHFSSSSSVSKPALTVFPEAKAAPSLRPRNV